MGGKTATSTQQVAIPPQVLAQYQSVNDRATQTANTPFQQYGSEFVAPVNQQQQAGIQGVNTGANMAQPYYQGATNTLSGAQAGTTGINQAATGLAASSAGAVDPSDLNSDAINKYMSPYLNTVLGSTAGLLNQNNQQQQAGQLGTAISSGAFGGDRTGIAAANLEQQQNLSNASIYSGIANQGYQSALGTAQQQQGVGLAAGQANRQARAAAGQELSGIGATTYGEGANTATTMAGLGAGAQTAALQGAQAQIGAGTVQQQTQQAQDTAQYNQFLQQQSYPFQVDQFLANIAEGTGALSGSTTTTQQPGGFFSDERLKEDMQPIGKTFDGQPIYRYKMKGDHREQIGLSAQKVEKKHPHAVGLAGGYRWVDYGKATEEAANRGHFYAGGGVSGGGRVWRPAAYAVGGSPSVVDQNDLRAILEAQQGMYAPMSNGAGVYGATGSVPRGGSSRVPAPSGATPHLVTASGGLRPQQTPMENVKGITDLGHSAAQLYNDYRKDHPQNTTTTSEGLAPAPAETPGDARAGGGRVGYEDGGGVDMGAILDAQQKMYQPHDHNRDIPNQSGGNHQLAVANGAPAPPPSGSSNVQTSIGLGKDAYGVYKHFNKPATTMPGTAPAATTPAAADTTGLGAADASAAGPSAAAAPAAAETAPAAAEVAAPAAAEGAGAAGAGAAEAGATTAATTAAGSAAAGAATDAAAEEAAALAAEYAASYAAMAAVAAARGGAIRSKHAAGGTPYRGDAAMYQDSGGTMDIPDTENSAKVQTAGPIKKQPTGLQTMMMMGDPNKSSSLAGGMFSNTALARGGLAGGRRGYEDGGSPDDVTDVPDEPQAVGLGRINRKPNPKDLLYTRDAGSQVPYAAPGLKGGNVPPAAVDPDVAAYTGGNYGANADSAWTPPGTRLSTHGATGSWDAPSGGGIPSATAAPVHARPKAAPAGLAAGSPDQGPPKPDQPPVAYTGGVGLSPTPAPDTSEKAPAKVSAEKSPSWWDKIKGSELAKPENLIPLLTAIGAMGTAPTRSLGVAASSGLLAGAQSYLPTKQALADIQQTGAQTERIGAETKGQLIENLSELQRIGGYNNQVPEEDPTGHGAWRTPDGKTYNMRQKGFFPAPQGGAPKYKMIGQQGVQAAQGQYQAFKSADPSVQAASRQQIEEINQLGNASKGGAIDLQRWEQTMATNKGFLDAGSMHELRTQAANTWDTIVKAAGHPELTIGGLPDAQMAAKLSTAEAVNFEQQHQQRSLGATRVFLAATPNSEMQREASIPLIADRHSRVQQDIDKMDYVNEMDQEGRRTRGGADPRSLIAQDALNSYNREYSQENYQAERDKLEGMLMSNKYPQLIGAIKAAKSPAEKQQIFDELDRNFGKNFHRYLTAGTGE
jgi:hypothetical protein